MEQPAIRVESLTKRYGAEIAVEDLSFEVGGGSVFGLVGRNGAGKTTTIRALLDLIRPTSGRLSVLGLDPSRHGPALRRRIGYLAEEPGLYPWMTVAETIRFNAAFYPAWDAGLAARLLRALDLAPRRRVRELSRGMQTKLGLLLALGGRPEILILDDPTAGLDPVVRREFLETVLAETHAAGGTVLFSTHLLDQLERVADEIAILHEGRLRLRGSIEGLKARFRRLRVVHAGEVPASFSLPGLLEVERGAHFALLTVDRFEPAQVGMLHAGGATHVEVMEMGLEEIFFTVTRTAGSASAAVEAAAPPAGVAHV